MDRSQWMTHDKASRILKELGPVLTKRYLRGYFANERVPVAPAVRRLEFAQFFFPLLLEDDPPEFHLQLFEDFALPVNTADAAPRGHAKTTVMAIEIIYRIVHCLNHYILPVSDTYSQARDQVDNVRQELESNALLRWVYGDLSTDWHWTSGAFTTSNEVRVVARGSNMKVRGLKYRQWRPDFVPIDDLENDEAVMKAERRDKLLNWVKRAVIPAMAARNAKIALVGTVLHDDSLLNNILKGTKGFAGWTKRRFSAIVKDEDGHEHALWPARFPLTHLVRMRDDPTYDMYLGPVAFAQEMQNEAVDDKSRIFKREWVFGPEGNPYTYSLTEKERLWSATHPPGSKSWVESELVQIIMAVDPAISEKTSADWFAAGVIGVDRAGHIWQLDNLRFRSSDIDLHVEKVVDMALGWGLDVLKIESVAYQAGLARAVRKEAAKRGKHLPVREVKPDKDKVRRAVIHSANFAGGLVHLRTDHELYDAFTQEILDFPVGEHDDMLDWFMHASEDLIMKQGARVFSRKPEGF